MRSREMAMERHPSKLGAACDYCHRRKIKCQPGDTGCQSCHRRRRGCTYQQVVLRKRKPRAKDKEEWMASVTVWESSPSSPQPSGVDVDQLLRSRASELTPDEARRARECLDSVPAVSSQQSQVVKLLRSVDGGLFRLTVDTLVAAHLFTAAGAADRAADRPAFQAAFQAAIIYYEAAVRRISAMAQPPALAPIECLLDHIREISLQCLQLISTLPPALASNPRN